MQKGLLRLNDEQLHWLEGRINIIDVQRGCPVQCITCGVSAPKYSGSMAWSDYMVLSNSILDVKEQKGIDIFVNEKIYPFWSSDPMYYHSIDGTKERTIYDIVVDLSSRHKKRTGLTTAGWKSDNDFMQRAIENIGNYGFTYANFDFFYSVKTVSRRVMNEYDSFLKKSENNIVNDAEFIMSSNYV